MRAIDAATERRLLAAGVSVFVASTIAVLVQMRSYEIPTLTALGEIAALTAFGAYVVIGGFIVVRRPGNIIGLMLVAYGSIWGLITAGIVTAEALDEAGRIDAAAWVSLAAFVPSLATIWLIAATWLLFPDGHPNTPLDRRLLRWSGALVAVVTVLSLFATPQVLPETKAYPHPFVGDSVAQAFFDIGTGVTILVFFFGYFVAARLIVRMRHGDAIERRQAGWIGVAVILNITILLGNVAIAPLGTEDRAFLLIDSVGIVLIPLAVGVAIFRYRLYDIDTIINRSVTFGALALFIGGVYIAIVVGFGELLGGDSGFGLSIAASVLVAMAFQPMRRRVEGGRTAWCTASGPRPTRCSCGSRAGRPSCRTRNCSIGCHRLIVDGTGALTGNVVDPHRRRFPHRVGMAGRDRGPPHRRRRRLRRPRGRLLAAGPPRRRAPGWAVTGEDRWRDGHARRGRPARRPRLRPRPGSAQRPADRQLAPTGGRSRGVARAGAGRIADEARRALENDLDSGPQQQLVALEGETRADPQAGRAGRRREDRGAAHPARRRSRSCHRGRAGLRRWHLPAAARSRGSRGSPSPSRPRRAAVPVNITADGVGRYSREVEAAVYFSVLEALQNTAKYSEAQPQRP